MLARPTGTSGTNRGLDLGATAQSSALYNLTYVCT